jgi:cytochrome c oxidase assembly protein subunit 11
MTAPQPDDLIRKNARTGLTVLAVVAFMIGLSFASVPLYSLFCRVTGFDGSPVVSEALPDKIIDREVTIRFNADTGRGMPWEFRPEMKEIRVRLGQKGLASFMAHNRLNKATSGTALYNVTPSKAGKYFHKIQCFCFDRQTLEPGQRVDMPVVFYIDPAMNDDPNMADVNEITLSYTFYEADSKELDTAMEGFYNSP